GPDRSAVSRDARIGLQGVSAEVGAEARVGVTPGSGRKARGGYAGAERRIRPLPAESPAKRAILRGHGIVRTETPGKRSYWNRDASPRRPAARTTRRDAQSRRLRAARAVSACTTPQRLHDPSAPARLHHP